MRLLMFTLLPLFVLASGCGDKDSPIEDEDDGDVTDTTPDEDTTCTTDSDCSSWEICEGGECDDGDRNNAVEEAESLLWGESRTGTINTSQDVDYYTFAADGGEFIRISTTALSKDVDTVITIRKENGKVLTIADAFATGTSISGTDAIAFAYLADAGTYSVSVEHRDSYYGSGASSSGRGEDYEIALTQWGDATSESDSSGSPSFTISATDSRIWYTVGVLLENPGDVDYIDISYTIPTNNMYLDGNADITGSDMTPRVRLLDDEGQPLTEKDNIGPDDYALYPQAPTGTYHLEVSDATGSGSENHWFFLHFIARPDSDSYPAVDIEDEPNDDVTFATELTVEEYTNSSGNNFSRGAGQGSIDSSGDEDWYRFEALYSPTYVVTCLNSELWGSAVLPSVELYTSAGALLATSDYAPGDNPNARIENIEVDAGVYYLRVLPQTEVTGGPDHWYRFNLFGASFSVSSYEDGGYSCP